MTVSTYKCTEGTCGGSITFDTEGPDGRPTQHSVYEQGKGPITSAYRLHDCPVRLGIWPPEIDDHPLAQKVA